MLLPALRVAKFSIPVPIALIAVFGIWWQFDKSSFAKKAVKTAVTELVVGAELEASRAEAEILAAVVNKLREDNKSLKENNLRFSEELQREQSEMNGGRINELVSRPVNSECVVDDYVFERMRK